MPLPIILQGCHPLLIVARAYLLAFSLFAGPSMLPCILQSRPWNWKSPHRFALSMALSFGLPAGVERWLKSIPDEQKMFMRMGSPRLQTFISNFIASGLAVTLLTREGGRKTLDLTLLFFVRALDALCQKFIGEKCKGRKADKAREMVDGVVFSLSSARIMWCFFYQPERLPRSYVKWILTLARIDPRLLETLRLIRKGTWSYSPQSSNRHLLTAYSSSLGYPASWGDPTSLPAYGGPSATSIWRSLKVNTRDGVGGLPCELVHGAVGGASCTSNAFRRGIDAFVKALGIYIPVHAIPVLATRPITQDVLLKLLGGAARSALFLATFIAGYWYAVCFTRTLVLARLMKGVSHNFWDGPYGCILLGCLACGTGSIWVEEGKRRGEMALYVFTRALRACLPTTTRSDWLIRLGNVVERVVFVVSLASLLTAYKHYPKTLRGISRWTLAFINDGCISKSVPKMTMATDDTSVAKDDNL